MFRFKCKQSTVVDNNQFERNKFQENLNRVSLRGKAGERRNQIRIQVREKGN